MATKAVTIVMLHGYPLSGKSTAAAKIKEHLNGRGLAAEVLSSAKLRLKGKKHGSTVGFIDERKEATRGAKDKAYKELCERAMGCLRKGVVPVIDATYHRYYRRKWVYDIAREKGAELYVVWTVFSDERAIRKYLIGRAIAKKLTALHTWQQYATMVGQTEKLEDYELKGNKPRVKVIRFERDGRGGKRIALYNCSSIDKPVRQIITALTS